jgi:hypothetical protein
VYFFGGKGVGFGNPRGHPLIFRFSPDHWSGLTLLRGREPSSSSTLVFKTKVHALTFPVGWLRHQRKVDDGLWSI